MNKPKGDRKKGDNGVIAQLTIQLMQQNSSLTMLEAANQARELYQKGVFSLFGD